MSSFAVFAYEYARAVAVGVAAPTVVGFPASSPMYRKYYFIVFSLLEEKGIRSASVGSLLSLETEGEGYSLEEIYSLVYFESFISPFQGR